MIIEDQEDDEVYGSKHRNVKKPRKNNGPFQEDIRKLMYGFGDDVKPDDASVDLLDAMVQEFISNLVARALHRSQRSGTNLVSVADVLTVLSTDEKKYLRMPYVLTMTKSLKSRDLPRNQVSFKDLQ